MRFYDRWIEALMSDKRERRFWRAYSVLCGLCVAVNAAVAAAQYSGGRWVTGTLQLVPLVAVTWLWLRLRTRRLRSMEGWTGGDRRL